MSSLEFKVVLAVIELKETEVGSLCCNFSRLAEVVVHPIRKAACYNEKVVSFETQAINVPLAFA